MKTLRTLLAAALALLLAPALRAQSIPNPSFEANSFTVFPGYANVGGNAGITGWTVTGNAGLNPADSSPFADNGAIPNGANVAFVQSVASAGSGVSTLSTTITGLTAGQTYTVRFRANRRAQTSAPAPEWALNGGTFVAFTASPAVNAFNAFTNPYYFVSGTFTANGTTAPLTILNRTANVTPALTDSTVLVDDFSISPSNAWSTTAWTDDASSGISAASRWAYHFGASATASVVPHKRLV